MTQLKKSLCFVLVFSLALTSMTVFAFTGVSAPKDNNTRSMDFLRALEILPEEIFEKDAETGKITRAQAAYAFTSVTGDFSGADDFFIDVDEENIYRSDIYSVYNYGLMRGTSTREFSPDENLTYFQAMKVLLTLAGYADVITAINKPFNTFENYADKLGLLANVAYDDVNSDITLGHFANMLYNTLNIAYYDMESIDNDGITYTATKETVLGALMNIRKYEGILQTFGNMRISASFGVTPDRITISGTQFKNSFEGAGRYLGANVFAYIDNQDRVLYVEPTMRNYGYAVIESNQKPIFSKGRLMYSDGNKDREYKISTTPDIIENYMPLEAAPNYTSLAPEYGYIELFDFDGDRTYEVVRIWDYDLYYIDLADQKAMIIRDKYTGTVLELGDDKLQLDVSITKDGKALAFEYIENNMVALVIESAVQDGVKIIDVSLSDSTIPAETYSISGDKTKLKMGDTTYFVNSIYARLMKNEGFNYGLDYKNDQSFVLDSNGFIAGVVTKESNSLKYGYLFASRTNPKNALSPTMQFRILDTAGDWNTFESKERFILNGRKIKPESCGALDKGIVLYLLDEDGKLAELFTHDNTREAQYGKLTLDRPVKARDVWNLIFTNETDGEVADFWATEAVIFIEPNPADADYATLCSNEKNYYCLSGLNVAESVSNVKNVQAYNVDADGYAGAVVMSYEGWKTNAQGYYPIIITDAYNAIDEKDGDVKPMVVGQLYNASSGTEYIWNCDGEEPPKIGDAMRVIYSADKREIIGGIIYCSDGTVRKVNTTINMSGEINSGYWFDTAKFVSLNGTVSMCVDKEKDFSENGTLGAEDYRFVRISGGTAFYVYDAKNETVTKGSSSDLEYGDRICYYVHNFGSYFVIIVKE